MAYIPYGYRIERGEAVIDREAEDKLKVFIGCYLDGSSRDRAAKEAGIPVSGQTVMSLIGKGVYLGDDYYPQILDASTLFRVAEERQKRYEKLGCFAENRKRREQAESVKKHFCVRVPDTAISVAGDGRGISEMMAFLFACIRPDSNGHRKITRPDKEKLVNLILNNFIDP